MGRQKIFTASGWLTYVLAPLLAVSILGAGVAAEPKATQAAKPAKPAGRVQEPKDFDRLDGHGATKKKVDVVEWEKNLEIHVYPKGSLKSLGLVVDRKSKTSKNPIMVIEYGFKSVAYTLIRRAMLTIPMNDTFYAFRDESASDYDKVIISNSQIAGLPKFTLAAAPTQLYPDHHAMLAAEGEVVEEEKAPPPLTPYEPPTPPSPEKSAGSGETDSRKKDPGKGRKSSPSDVDAEGAIRNFAF